MTTTPHSSSRPRRRRASVASVVAICSLAASVVGLGGKSAEATDRQGNTAHAVGWDVTSPQRVLIGGEGKSFWAGSHLIPAAPQLATFCLEFKKPSPKSATDALAYNLSGVPSGLTSVADQNQISYLAGLLDSAPDDAYHRDLAAASAYAIWGVGQWLGFDESSSNGTPPWGTDWANGSIAGDVLSHSSDPGSNPSRIENDYALMKLGADSMYNAPKGSAVLTDQPDVVLGQGQSAVSATFTTLTPAGPLPLIPVTVNGLSNISGVTVGQVAYASSNGTVTFGGTLVDPTLPGSITVSAPLPSGDIAVFSAGATNQLLVSGANPRPMTADVVFSPTVHVNAIPTISTTATPSMSNVLVGQTSPVSDTFVATGEAGASATVSVTPIDLSTGQPAGAEQSVSITFDGAGNASGTVGPWVMPAGNFEFAETLTDQFGQTAGHNPLVTPVGSEQFGVHQYAVPTVGTTAQTGLAPVRVGATQNVNDTFAATGEPGQAYTVTIQPVDRTTGQPVAPAQSVSGVFAADGTGSGVVGPFAIAAGVSFEFAETITDGLGQSASRDPMTSPVVAEQGFVPVAPSVSTAAQSSIRPVIIGPSRLVSDTFMASGAAGAAGRISVRVYDRTAGGMTSIPAQSASITFDAAGQATGSVGPFAIPADGVAGSHVYEFAESLTTTDGGGSTVVVSRDPATSPDVAEQFTIVTLPQPAVRTTASVHAVNVAAGATASVSDRADVTCSVANGTGTLTISVFDRSTQQVVSSIPSQTVPVTCDANRSASVVVGPFALPRGSYEFVELFVDNGVGGDTTQTVSRDPAVAPQSAEQVDVYEPRFRTTAATVSGPTGDGSVVAQDTMIIDGAAPGVSVTATAELHRVLADGSRVCSEASAGATSATAKTDSAGHAEVTLPSVSFSIFQVGMRHEFIESAAFGDLTIARSCLTSSNDAAETLTYRQGGRERHWYTGGPAPKAVDGDVVPATPVDGDVSIPKLKVNAAQLFDQTEAAASKTIKRGFYHVAESAPLCSKAGVAVVAAHRSTWGGSLRRINKLVPGDELTVRVGSTTCTYRLIWSFVVPAKDTQAFTDLTGADSSVDRGRLAVYSCTNRFGTATGKSHRFVALFEVVG